MSGGMKYDMAMNEILPTVSDLHFSTTSKCIYESVTTMTRGAGAAVRMAIGATGHVERRSKNQPSSRERFGYMVGVTVSRDGPSHW